MNIWEDNVKMNPGEMGWELVNWIHFIQDRDKRQALVKKVI
jgi:hypothetical protein